MPTLLVLMTRLILHGKKSCQCCVGHRKFVLPIQKHLLNTLDSVMVLVCANLNINSKLTNFISIIIKMVQKKRGLGGRKRKKLFLFGNA